MKVDGRIIEPKAIEACINRMKSGPFAASDITRIAIANGVPEKIGFGFVARRVTSRLIEKAKKTNSIKVGPPFPTWTPVEHKS